MNIDKKCNASFIHLIYTVLNDSKTNRIKKSYAPSKKRFFNIMEERKIIVQINKISNGASAAPNAFNVKFFPMFVSINKSPIKSVFDKKKKYFLSS